MLPYKISSMTAGDDNTPWPYWPRGKTGPVRLSLPPSEVTSSVTSGNIARIQSTNEPVFIERAPLHQHIGILFTYNIYCGKLIVATL